MSTGANTNQNDPMQHPLEAISQGIQSVSGEKRAPRQSHMGSANEGPADVIAKVSGAVQGGIREDDGPYFTNNEGHPWPDTAHSKTVGGLPLASDVWLFQKQQTFNRSKNLERMVHPCGSGAFGYFECTQKVDQLTKANFLSSVGEKTPVFVRFSTVTVGREYPDEARNPRGFAIKFYTAEGNYDIVGLNFPVFFCRDPIQGPDVIRSQARNPKNFLPDYDAIFDLLANTPESNHAGLMFFSDHGTPVGWRFNHGYGCHTFKWVNAQGKFVYIKYHFIAKHGQKQFTQEQATRMCGEDPDFSKRDLWETIESGTEPLEWTAMVQVMEPQDADPEKLGFDPFDVTKIWPRAQFPMREFGRLVLNKNPENYHRDVEQAAFSPGSMVPGIEDSPDPLLQFRMFFYRDAQYHRIGVNLHQIPVNCPFLSKSFSPLQFDGPMRVDANHAGNKQYTPNSFAHKFRPDVAEAPYQVSDNIVSRKSHYWHEAKRNEYDQPRELWSRVMTEEQRQNTIKNTFNMLKFVGYADIQKKYLAQVYNIGTDYARGIYDLLVSQEDEAKRPGFGFDEVEKLAETAHVWFKEEKFRPSGGERLTGYAPTVPVYN
ncbi:KatE Catalase [Pyrenophora tritici-repentis]|uniref:Catalase n=1 Tax=Pyrenophora tritici-repentis TaxID=45151 RepID=A0A2W1G0N2_9PLEO|nr:Catalase [Pyrenophora tritici-repentis]KAI1517883.1 Catalase [Pyrenophora tritici-repentis]KAI1531371.1 KatE Catalase [Pyrenophora tritici-repentis]KAI1533305.1 KatE Catalase [Pyrenophora tritici-repentis]KAI1549542.1 KatE Catalase [Pyrenophora tritici-repentis]